MTREETGEGRTLPKRFDSPEAEVDYWQRTDLTELAPGELEDVLVERVPSRKTTFAVRLDQSAVDRLRILARERGIGPTQLVREWIMSRIERETSLGRVMPTSTVVREKLREAVICSLLEGVPEVVDDVLREASPGTAPASEKA